MKKEVLISLLFLLSGCVTTGRLPRYSLNCPVWSGHEQKITEDGDLAKSYVRSMGANVLFGALRRGYAGYVSEMKKYLKDEHRFTKFPFPEFYVLRGEKIIYEKNSMPRVPALYIRATDIYLYDIRTHQKIKLNKQKILTRNWEVSPQVRLSIPFPLIIAVGNKLWDKEWCLASSNIPSIKYVIYKDVKNKLFLYNIASKKTIQINPPDTKVLKWQVTDKKVYYETTKSKEFIFAYSMATGKTEKIKTGPRTKFWKVSPDDKLLVFCNKARWFYINLEKRPFSISGPILETPKKSAGGKRVVTVTKKYGSFVGVAMESLIKAATRKRQDVSGYFFIDGDSFVLSTIQGKEIKSISGKELLVTHTFSIYNFKTGKVRFVNNTYDENIVAFLEEVYDSIKKRLKVSNYYVISTGAAGNSQKFRISNISISPDGKKGVFSFSKKIKGTYFGRIQGKELSDILQISSGNDNEILWPKFSPEGDYIYYLSPRGKFWNIFRISTRDLTMHKCENTFKTSQGIVSRQNGKIIMTESQKKTEMRKYFNKATQLYLQGKYEEAIKYWEKVLEIDPNHKLSKIKIRKAKKKLREQKLIGE